MAGVAVAVDGISADQLTDAQGRYTVHSPYELDAQVSITAWKPGFQGGELMVDEDALARTSASQAGGSAEALVLQATLAPAMLDVVQPAVDAIIDLGPCCNADLEVRGIVSGPPRDNLYLDVLVAIDLSGSIEAKAAFDDELAAARALVAKLDLRTTRVGLIAFAADARVALPLTSNALDIAEALDALEEDGTMALGEKGSGTHFAAALRAATDELEDQGKLFVSSETGKKELASPRQILVLLTDGIPTLPSQPGSLQDKADINATLGAARHAAAKGVEVHGFAFAVDQADKTLTTLPAIAAITSGQYHAVDDPAAVALDVPTSSFVGMGTVTVKNQTTGQIVSTMPSPDGYFSATVSIEEGPQTLEVVAFDASGTLSTSLSLTVTGQTDIAAGEPVGLAGDPVSAVGLVSPIGKDLTGGSLYRLLVGQSAEFADAISTSAGGVFAASGAPDALVAVTGELVYSDACYKSDVGFLALLPGQDVAAAFAAASNRNVLINSGKFVRCSPYVLQPGVARFSFQVPAGSAVVFFMVPDSTLAKAQQGKVQPLFTEPSANPGGYAQTMAFHSTAGRRGQGGGASVIAFEDLAIVTKYSDQDYDDLVLFVDDMVPTQRACGCE